VTEVLSFSRKEKQVGNSGGTSKQMIRENQNDLLLAKKH